MTTSDADNHASLGSPQLAEAVVACAARTVATTGVRVEFRQDSTRPQVQSPKRRRRRGGLLRPLGKLASIAVKGAWKRATRNLNFGHMVGKGILDPSTGRYMIDYGSFAQINDDGKTFGGRSGRCLDTLDPFPDPGNTIKMPWLLHLLAGVTNAVADGEEVLHGTHCTRLAARADLEKASAVRDEGLRVPSVDRFERLHELPVTVWIDGEHVRRVEFDHPDSQHLTLELWDYGIATHDYDWTRLPTFRSPGEAAHYAGEDPPWHRRLRRRLRRRPARSTTTA